MHTNIQQPQHIYIHQDSMIFIDLYLLIIMEYKYVYIPRYNIRPLYTVPRDILVKVHRSKYITPVNLEGCFRIDHEVPFLFYDYARSSV